MEYRIEALESFEIVGLFIDCKHDDTAGIVPLWDSFFPHMERLGWKNPVWGVCLANGDAQGFRYVCAFEVTPETETPEGLTRFTVPAHRFLVHKFKDLPTNMSKQWQATYPGLVKEAGMKADLQGPWLESYTHDGYDYETGEIACELYTPVM